MEPVSLAHDTQYVVALAMAPDGRLFSGSDDRTIKMWSAEGRHLQTLEGHDDTVWALVVAPNGSQYFPELATSFLFSFYFLVWGLVLCG